MTAITVTAGTPSDYDSILMLNEGAVPHVNSIPRAKLAYLHGQGIYLGVARQEDRVAGFLLALDERADYDSENFGYFKHHYARFAYVDRIVVAESVRGTGVGAALYANLALHIPCGCPWLTCEVNLRPANAASLAFHRRLGFTSVGEQETGGGAKRVCLLAKPLEALTQPKRVS